MAEHVCEHLRALEDELVARRVRVTSAGQAWSSNCRHWIYFDAVLDCEAIRKRLALDPCVVVHVNDDARSGRERGLDCSVHHDAIMGAHPADAKGRAVIS